MWPNHVAAIGFLPVDKRWPRSGLDELAAQGIGHLQVACLEGDPLHRALRPSAIAGTRYLLAADLALDPRQPVVIDVRCL